MWGCGCVFGELLQRVAWIGKATTPQLQVRATHLRCLCMSWLADLVQVQTTVCAYPSCLCLHLHLCLPCCVTAGCACVCYPRHPPNANQRRAL